SCSFVVRSVHFGAPRISRRVLIPLSLPFVSRDATFILLLMLRSFDIRSCAIATLPLGIAQFQRSFVHALRTLPIRALSRSSAERPHAIAPPAYGIHFRPVYAASRWTASISSLKSPHVHGNCFVPADAALRSFSTVSPGAFAAKPPLHARPRHPPPPPSQRPCAFASAPATAPVRARLRPRPRLRLRHSARARSLPPPAPPPPRRPYALASAPATAPVRARFRSLLRLRHGTRARSLPPPPPPPPPPQRPYALTSDAPVRVRSVHFSFLPCRYFDYIYYTSLYYFLRFSTPLQSTLLVPSLLQQTLPSCILAPLTDHICSSYHAPCALALD
ncbi:hypothetical protein C8J57DRAFT_1623942, partial [Mycena rebaudengoi]